MTTGLTAFRRIQVGEEGTPGTAVAATEILYGTLATWMENRTIVQPEEDRNNLSRHMADAFVAGKEGQLVWTGLLNQRHCPYIFSMGLCGNVSPTQPDPTNEPNAYLWTFTPSLTAPNTPDQANGIDTFTFEFGDNLQAYEVEYCFATRIEISGSPNEGCMFTCDITGRQRTDTTFTAALTAQTVQHFPFNLAKFYIDTAWADLGNTQKQGLLKAFTWTHETQFRASYGADGSLYFYAVDKEAPKTAQLRLVYARTTDADSERTKYEGVSTTYLRIALEGATELDAGQSNVPYIRLDGAYQYFDWPTPGEEDGLSTVEVTAESVYDSTGGKQLEVAVLTDLDAFPS
jgi:hypothetical protein